MMGFLDEYFFSPMGFFYENFGVFEDDLVTKKTNCYYSNKTFSLAIFLTLILIAFW